MTSGLAVNRYVDAYTAFARGADGPLWVRDLRESAMARVAGSGLPSQKEEEWKYTNVSPIAKLAVHVPSHTPGTLTAAQIASETIVADAPRLVFVNGIYAPDFSVPDVSRATVIPLSAAMQS